MGRSVVAPGVVVSMVLALITMAVITVVLYRPVVLCMLVITVLARVLSLTVVISMLRAAWQRLSLLDHLRCEAHRRPFSNSEPRVARERLGVRGLPGMAVGSDICQAPSLAQGAARRKN
jgi:hypothetical protein